LVLWAFWAFWVGVGNAGALVVALATAGALAFALAQDPRAD
jgi:hypothetical protein